MLGGFGWACGFLGNLHEIIVAEELPTMKNICWLGILGAQTVSAAIRIIVKSLLCFIKPGFTFFILLNFSNFWGLAQQTFCFSCEDF